MALTLSKARIEALSDGIFAIAMTLLVLELKAPEVMHHDSDAMMLRELLDLRLEFASYAATFLIAAAFWFLHHQTFHFIRHVNGFLLWVNLLFLMFISLLPFSSGLMGHLFVHPVTQLFYFGNQLAIALLLNLHWQYARRKRFLIDTDVQEADRLGFRIMLTVAIFAACLVTAIFLPEFSLLPIPAFLIAGAIIERARD